MYLALENNILVRAATAHKVLRYRLHPCTLLCLAGMAINSFPTLDWCTLSMVTQIHPTSLCPHLFLHAGTHPTNHLMLVSLPARACANSFPHPEEGDGLADTNALSSRGSAGRWASTEREKETEEEISPRFCVIVCVSLDFAVLHLLLSIQCCADSIQVAAQPFRIYLCSST